MLLLTCHTSLLPLQLMTTQNKMICISNSKVEQSFTHSARLSITMTSISGINTDSWTLTWAKRKLHNSLSTEIAVLKPLHNIFWTYSEHIHILYYIPFRESIPGHFLWYWTNQFFQINIFIKPLLAFEPVLFCQYPQTLHPLFLYQA